MTKYEAPTLTDLGNVEDLTQLTITIKLAHPGTDIHFNKNGVQKVKNAPNAGVTASFGGGGATPA